MKQQGFLDDVIGGLSLNPKRLSPKYFYDEAGSALFEEICQLPEYYLSRTEGQILSDHSEELIDMIAPGSLLIEYGSGNSHKTRSLLQRSDKFAAYVPIDISEKYLMRSAGCLRELCPGLQVTPVCADFMDLTCLPEGVAEGQGPLSPPKVLFMPGSTIGNLDEEMRSLLLGNMRSLLGTGNDLILGIDLVKDKEILEKAYNDRDGVTSQFNLNILSRINRELNGRFDLGSFRHFAYYNSSQDRIEMHLMVLRDQTVQVGEHAFDFKRGESIHTENSYKFTLDRFLAEMESRGFRCLKVWMDEKKYFAELYLRVCA